MTTLVFSLLVAVLLVLAVAILVGRRDRSRSMSSEDPTALRAARAEQARTDVQRHLGQSEVYRSRTPNST
ncbi:hypothetical protein O7598_28845 [Micromonospora sp. WMMC241]|uniref:hypothetical protein n=1 Tax=Micromonospora sp. WMMC241 TaxID=3015159 RepID=UPI0022B5F255|nr:hypothetical protein [Micromonospora sp. WMMC241]MCZ7440431.1 hypothetical protein [Micromonospora sp. WMMC241]